MNIAAVLAAVAAKEDGWEELLIDNWDCILRTEPTYIKLLEILTGQGVNPNATSGQNLIDPTINGEAIGTTHIGNATGTPYSLTNTAAALDFGTADPAIVLTEPGTWWVSAQIHLAYAGATVAAETATLKVRRTNNTPADVSTVPVIDLPVATTLTHSYGSVVIPTFLYVTANNDDALAIFGNLSAALGAGNINAVAPGTSIQALRLF